VTSHGAAAKHLPRILIAAPASGQGKTTVAVGMMAALTQRGYAVAPAKSGPDYIDPGYHALATGRPGRNLDPWMVEESDVVPLFVHGFTTPEPADVAIIEGAMGLFDGRLGTDGFASSAHLARLTQTPVVVVVDISSASRTIAATIHGLRTFDPRITVAGVVLNQSGSARHAAEVRCTVEATGMTVLGVLPRDAGISAPSRHLGLVPAAERPDAAATLERLAEQVEQFIDLDAVLALARSAPELDVTPWQPGVALGVGAVADGPKPVVAIAGGRAFTFRYAETEELLRAAGCDAVTFDPATDAGLPSGVAGLYLGGGFPEVHAAALSGNESLRRDIRDAIGSGLPTVAECAGLLYLCDVVEGQSMVGAVGANADMHPRLTLGYREAHLAVDSLLGPAGTAVRGHEFHRTRTDPAAAASPAWQMLDASGETRPDGFALDPAGTGTPTLHAAYLHVHWAGNPHLAANFAAAARAFHPGQRVAAPETTPRLSEARAGAAAVTTPAITRASTGIDLDHHGDREVGPGLVDFAVNVRLPKPPQWLADVICGSIGDLGAYPDPTAARAAIAARHGVSPDMVLPTSGGAEAFTLIAQAINGRHPLVVHPQFTEPEAALRRLGRLPERHLLRADDDFALDPTIVSAAADLVMVGNPTNPTGVLHTRESLTALRRPGRALIVDEAFIDAVPGEPESIIDVEMEGLLVVRSLTKTWGLAGLRAGYAVGDPVLIAQLEAFQSPWSVSSLAAAVMVATATSEAVAESDLGAAQLGLWREHLAAGLRRLGLAPVVGAAPFALVQLGAGVHESLREAGFAVRRCDTFPGLDETWVRIAARPNDLVDSLLEQIERIIDVRDASASGAPSGSSITSLERSA